MELLRLSPVLFLRKVPPEVVNSSELANVTGSPSASKSHGILCITTFLPPASKLLVLFLRSHRRKSEAQSTTIRTSERRR